MVEGSSRLQRQAAHGDPRSPEKKKSRLRGAKNGSSSLSAAHRRGSLNDGITMSLAASWHG